MCTHADACMFGTLNMGVQVYVCRSRGRVGKRGREWESETEIILYIFIFLFTVFIFNVAS